MPYFLIGFKYEKGKNKKNSKRYMLSLILISFIDLGIIEFIEER